jgi:hypothetical protein
MVALMMIVKKDEQWRAEKGNWRSANVSQDMRGAEQEDNGEGRPNMHASEL